MKNWFDSGCEFCQRCALTSWDPMIELGDSADMHAYLRQCPKCGAFWQYNEREAHVIDELEARHDFPEAFQGR
jgi:hypothetical protein